MKNIIIAGNIYHVLNRGVDKRKIFMDEQDYFRFIHDLFEFNDTKPINNISHSFKHQYYASAKHYVEQREFLVEILAFCLMPNHYHLLIKPRFDDGVTKFIKRLNMGYARYFNEKYERKGALFEGRFKRIAVNNDAHFIHLPYYIHLNPLDLIMKEWRGGEISDYKKAINFLENYRWSSFQDYIGKRNFPLVIQKEFLTNCFGDADQFKNNMIDWLKDLDLSEIKHISLE